MDAKDLMIGDWVMTEVGIMRVAQIFKNHIDCNVPTGSKIWKITTIEPIPLTPEILEKNGFKRVRDKLGRVFYSIADDYFDLTIDEITDSIWCIEYDDLEAHFPTCRNLVAHVHELQHVLRLCGVEKEITI